MVGMSKGRRILLPKDKYVSQIEINADNIHVQFKKKQKIALLFICLNERYWPYLVQVMKDAQDKFLPHHTVDFFVWTDVDTFEGTYQQSIKDLNNLSENSHTQPIEQALKEISDYVIPLITRFGQFKGVENIVQTLAKQQIVYKRDSDKMWIETPRAPGPWMSEVLLETGKAILGAVREDLQFIKKNATIEETTPMEWPIPTLMRYHLFLNREEKLNEYDSIFYLDADMRVVDKISDEVLSEGLTAAEHPMYSLKKEYIPPYEPNPASSAYIHRPGKVIDEAGKKRFKPYYYAGGFQGGAAQPFIQAMKVMKKNIDTDFNKNYMAIWNDESHWNKYLSDYKGELTVLSPAYIYPDSLTKEYYEPLWGQSYQPKIVTLTKPFSLSKEGGEHIREFLKKSV